MSTALGTGKVGFKWKMTVVTSAGVYPPVVATVAAASLLGIAKDADLTAAEADMVEVSSRAGNGHKNYEYGLDNWSAGTKALWVPSNAALIVLQTAILNKTKVDVLFQEDSASNGQNFVGVALVKSFKIGLPLNGEVMYDIALQGDGALVPALNA